MEESDKVLLPGVRAGGMGRVPAFIALLVLFAAVGPAAALGAGDSTPDASSGATIAADADAPPDPEEDVIGWENGVWYNESIDVDQSDGLSAAELDRFVARSMARVEVLREKEFKQDVPVEVITREEYRERQAARESNETFNRWNDQVWEALFIVGEDTGSEEALGNTLGASVAGFYSSRDDEIKIVTDSPDSPIINNATLLHELVHALQDQYFNLSDPKYGGETQDEQLAADGVVEGEANYIQKQYAERCASGEWECVDTPDSDGGGASPGVNLGVLLTLFQPYSDGPLYVDRIVSNGGWEAFDEEFQNPPTTSEQIIHLTDEEPDPIEYEDTARNGWELFPNQGVNGSDTVGEASIFAMFWYQAREYGADTLDPASLLETENEFDTYNYSATPSAGWGNDRVFPYRNTTGEEALYGYVWVTEWDTQRDAELFEAAYLEILETHDARETTEGYYVVPSGPFEDAFLVVRNDTRVTIVNGPTVDAVKDIRPTLEPTDASQTTPTATPVTTTSGGVTDDDSETEASRTPGPTETTGAGFGFAVAIVAVGVAALLARLR